MVSNRKEAGFFSKKKAAPAPAPASVESAVDAPPNTCSAADGGACASACTAPHKPAEAIKPYCYVPKHISEEAQAYLSTAHPKEPQPDIVQQRAYFDARTKPAGTAAADAFLQSTEEATLAGVPCVYATPKGHISSSNPASRQLLLYLHGGAYSLGSCKASAWQVAAPVAHAAGLKVLCVDYRLAPEHPFPAALDDALAVYKYLLTEEGYDSHNIVMLGDSAGGGLVMALLQLLNKLPDEHDNLEMPAAVVLYSPWVDLLPHAGDSTVTLTGVDPMLRAPTDLDSPAPAALAYVAGNASMLSDPLVSPLYGVYDDAPFSPTLLQVGLRDILISSNVMLYRKMRAAGQHVIFSPFEAMWHVFQAFWNIPEAQVANEEAAEFFRDHMPQRGGAGEAGDADVAADSTT
uniref:Alpha/beta hydrolase fold-3 domain-containing protein n=1 Tax=Tetradesmus obliquus TaxID=3088 RepID=A0A383VRR2_TETOB|eukprot:jgi/Sobl393_1/14537/SZX68207.1